MLAYRLALMLQRWIRKRKRPAGSGLWGGYEVDRDEHGVWLYTPEGSHFRGTSVNGEVAECFAGKPDEPGLHVMQLLPGAGAWWVGHWKVWSGQRILSIDISTPATLAANEWGYTDLELDLFKSSDGTLGIFDDDEFEEAVANGFISESERRVCRETASALDHRLRSGRDPLLDSLAWSRLESAIALRLAPITDLC